MPKFLFEINNYQTDDQKQANPAHIFKKTGKDNYMLVNIYIAPG